MISREILQWIDNEKQRKIEHVPPFAEWNEEMFDFPFSLNSLQRQIVDVILWIENIPSKMLRGWISTLIQRALTWYHGTRTANVIDSTTIGEGNIRYKVFRCIHLSNINSMHNFANKVFRLHS